MTDELKYIVNVLKSVDLEDGSRWECSHTSGKKLIFECHEGKTICVSSIGYSIKEIVELNKLIENES